MADDPEFVHLHVHSQYSMLDSAVKLKALTALCAERKMPAVAVTDHANMFCAVSFYKAARAAGVRPILGAEIDVFDGKRVTHLPLLAETREGYQNLAWLVSEAQVAPTPDAGGRLALSLEQIAQRAEGLIAMTGCMGGLVPQAVLHGGESAGKEALGRLAEIFDGRLYVELQDHGLPEQTVLIDVLTKLAESAALPVVVTNDVHYLARDDADAHLYLSCIKSGRSYNDAREHHHGASEMYFKTPHEMAQLFGASHPGIAATLEIAERCQVELELGKPMLPTFPVPKGFDTDSYFRHVASEGLASRFREFRDQGKSFDEAAYRARLEQELDIICKMQFPGYFLIVWDFIRYAKEHGVPVGPGRGSGAGSLVAYALRITDLDPLPYNLLFERFLNPERVSMPDFDIDFCMDRRDVVISYVQQKYGEESVGQIATFAELKAKSVIKDVARAMGISPGESQQIANLIPRKTPAETYTISESLALEPKLKARYDTDSSVHELVDQATRLEGLTRHAGKHAAGIVISEGPLWAHVPCFRDEKSGAYVTQYYKDDVELAGLVKFDFLGLKTLTVLDIAQRLINARPDHGARRTFDLAKIPLDDRATYQLLGSGETKGVFQLESSGMQQLFKDLRADCFEDIVAAVALYRPGPLGAGMVTNFVNRKHGREAIGKMHELVDELLKPTYGVVVYQEQVMQIAQALAGYTLGGADLLRRAMGKKKPEEMAKQKTIFIEGAKGKGVDEADAERIFGLLEYFAGYGFNKSHSAAYALITYQTAYLKAHFPVELLCAIMTSDKDRNEKVVRTIADARAHGVTVLPPDINESDTDFKVVYTHPAGDRKARRRERIRDPLGPQIRFGLGAVRGVGEAALETLFEARAEGGAFKDLFDFASRVDAKRINRGVLEALVQCGAFDSTLAPIGVARAQAFASIDLALERSRSASRDRAMGQTSMFAMFDADASNVDEPPVRTNDYDTGAEWDRHETLVRERQALGFYVSGHPLDRYLTTPHAASRLDVIPCSDCSKSDDWSMVRIAGMVEGYRERVFRDGGGKIAFFELEDRTGRVNVKVRGGQIDRFGAVLTASEPLVVSGKVSFPRRDDDAPEDDGAREATILLDEAVPLSAMLAETKRITLRLKEEQITEGRLERLRSLIDEGEGSCPVSVAIALTDGTSARLSLEGGRGVRVDDRFLAGLERVFGEQIAELG